jgi:cytochrome P450
MREEFARVVGPVRGITMDDLKELRFCCAVFNEVLRMHPPVSIDGRLCSSDDVVPSGVAIPRGTFVWIPNAAIGRDPNRWERPDEFVPDRWLSTSAEPIRRVDEYLHPVFWGGPRLCIGKDAARLEVVAVAKEFLQHFDFVVGEKNDLRIAPAPVQFYEHGIWGVLKPVASSSA